MRERVAQKKRKEEKRKKLSLAPQGIARSEEFQLAAY